MAPRTEGVSKHSKGVGCISGLPQHLKSYQHSFVRATSACNRFLFDAAGSNQQPQALLVEWTAANSPFEKSKLSVLVCSILCSYTPISWYVSGHRDPWARLRKVSVNTPYGLLKESRVTAVVSLKSLL